MPEVVHWNPRLRLAERGVLWRVQLPKRQNNFGDLLGPLLVDRICAMRGIRPDRSDDKRLLTVGSIINIAAQEGDTVWGSGIHGNFLPLQTPLPALDVRAVRGPLTAEVLRSNGIAVPEVYGDPALLIPHLWSDSELGINRGSGGTVVVPNFYDLAGAPKGSINPRGKVLDRVRAIASAKKVIASSLHGIIIAEAYGVSAVLVASSSEKPFKYQDYYQGTGRQMPPLAPDWESAYDAPAASPIETWDHQPLLDNFPADLWALVRTTE